MRVRLPDKTPLAECCRLSEVPSRALPGVSLEQRLHRCPCEAPCHGLEGSGIVEFKPRVDLAEEEEDPLYGRPIYGGDQQSRTPHMDTKSDPQKTPIHDPRSILRSLG